MKIVIDNKIPYIQEKLQHLADQVVALGGAEISPDDVRDADALIVRTRTRCDELLLKGSSVQFVATATIGFDHIDTDYLQRVGIPWTNCPGCNAASVAQYLESTLLLLQRDKGVDLCHATIGIVGCGHVGSKVRSLSQRLGLRVLVCDPPLAAKESTNTPRNATLSKREHPSPNTYVSMDVIERECDIITFHVPLTRDGSHPTYHLADEAFFHRLQRRPYIINTSRGEVVDNQALLAALCDGRVQDAVLDVWEHEPQLDLQLLQRVFIGTPHIAGYSADGKVNADNMVIDALCHHFDLPHPGYIEAPALPADHPASLAAHPTPLDYYNPLADSVALKARPDHFEYLRNHYPLRREGCSY